MSEPLFLGRRAGTSEACLSVEEARVYYERAGGGHDFDHVLRVYATGEHIARAEGADLAVVRTAILLHDVAAADSRTKHHEMGAARAERILAGRPADFVSAVKHAIEAHRFRCPPDPTTLEAKVVYDADKIDAIGAIGVARVFAYAGARPGTPLWSDPWRTIAERLLAGKRVDERSGQGYSPAHEFVYKLDRIPDLLYTAAARSMAQQRRIHMRLFFDLLDAEMLAGSESVQDQNATWPVDPQGDEGDLGES